MPFPKHSPSSITEVVLSRIETAGSDAHIYDTEVLINIIVPLSSRYCLHTTDFKTAWAVFFPSPPEQFFPQTQRAATCCVWLIYLFFF